VTQAVALRAAIVLFAIAGCGGGSRSAARMDAGSGDAPAVKRDAPGDNRPDSATSDASHEVRSDPTDAGATCQPGDAGADRRRSFIDFQITGAAFDGHNGSTIHLYTAGSSVNDVYGLGRQVIAGGGFVLELPAGYKRGSVQAVVWFVDVDGDGVCNSGNDDHSGFATVGPFDPGPGADERFEVTISDNHINPYHGSGDPCAGATAPLLDLDITGSAFGAHEGQTIHLVTSSPNNDVVRATGQAIIQGGTFAFHFPRGLERFTYQDVFWFVDVDGDGRCTTGADHTGYVSTAAFNPVGDAPLQMMITDNHAASLGGLNICAIVSGCRPPP
jgi:hypothetical protein